MSLEPWTRPGIAVVGMHRSGTSVVTRLINLLGASLGREDDLHSEGSGDPPHWESAALVAMNDRILREFGCTWYAGPALPDGWVRSDAAERLLPAMREAFAGVYSGTAPWVWKDPRLCLTLPLWRRILNIGAAVFVHRAAGPVATSLRRRNRFPLWYGLALWNRYNHAAMAAGAGLPLVSLSFERLIADPTGVAQRIRDDLEAAGISLRLPAAAAARAVRREVLHDDQACWIDRIGRFASVLDALPAATPSFAPPDIRREPRWSTLALAAYGRRL